MSMLETPTEIQQTVSSMGELLTFPTYIIYGILGFMTSDLFSGSLEQQIWEIQIASVDTKTYSISVDDTFIYLTNEYKFIFSIDRPPIPYGDGWDRLAVLLISTDKI